MRNYLLLLLLFMCIFSQAQLSVGPGTLSLYNGSVLKVDKLILSPTQQLDIADNHLVQNSTPVALNGSVNSIEQVLTFSNPVIFTGSVRMYFDPNFLNGNPAGNLKMSYRNATNWHSSSQSSVNMAENYVDDVLTAQAFRGLTASVDYIALPVALVSFTAKWQYNETVMLQWQTAAETENSHFTIERSDNGRHFTTIAKLNSAAASAGATYNHTDLQPPSGTIYYRLRQHDRDGKSTLFGTRMLQSGNAGKISLYPNPVSGGGFMVEMKKTSGQPLSYAISNAAGQVVQTGQLSARQQWMATATLPAGFYVLQVSNGQSVRFQKQ